MTNLQNEINNKCWLFALIAEFAFARVFKSHGISDGPTWVTQVRTMRAPYKRRRRRNWAILRPSWSNLSIADIGELVKAT